MIHQALLGLIEEAASDILTLTELLGESEFFGSRLTHAETIKRLRRIAAAAEDLPAATRAALPEIDWARWECIGRELAAGTAGPLTVWTAVQELAPDTLQWLRVHRRAQPQIFALSP